jgi:hypothetical protein
VSATTVPLGAPGRLEALEVVPRAIIIIVLLRKTPRVYWVIVQTDLPIQGIQKGVVTVDILDIAAA